MVESREKTGAKMGLVGGMIVLIIGFTISATTVGILRAVDAGFIDWVMSGLYEMNGWQFFSVISISTAAMFVVGAFIFFLIKKIFGV